MLEEHERILTSVDEDMRGIIGRRRSYTPLELVSDITLAADCLSRMLTMESEGVLQYPDSMGDRRKRLAVLCRGWRGAHPLPVGTRGM